MTQGNSWKIFPKYMILNKNWNWRFSGDDSEGFLENFSRQISRHDRHLDRQNVRFPTLTGAEGRFIDWVFQYYLYDSKMIRNSFESYPNNENKLFSLEGTHEMKLETFSRNASHSWPEIRKQTFFLSRYSGNSAGKIFQKCSSLMTRNQKFWKMSGKIFQETLWVTTRFLEIFSRIWQYGLSCIVSIVLTKNVRISKLSSFTISDMTHW